MKLNKNLNWLVVVLLCYFNYSCEEFLEVEVPGNKLIRDEVFRTDETAKSAMKGIYNELFVAAFSNGHWNSVSFLSGLSADNLQLLSTANLPRMEFMLNEIHPDNPHNLELWAGAYNIIYMTNSFLEGLSNSEEISPDLASQLEGEARFVRAFTYFYLVNLYGDVPLILTTNYKMNDLASRDAISEIYLQVIEDLELSRSLLSTNYSNEDRTQVNEYATTALLARVHLYLENWGIAESLSSEIIEANGMYEILENPNEVFLANSKEAIWQISALGDGEMTTHTMDGDLFIIDPVYWFFATVKLTEDLLSSFEESDLRSREWIGYNQMLNAYYAYKYKIWNSNQLPVIENSMVLRLAEQYFIRAEAKAKQGNLAGAIEDLDVLRKRAGIKLLSETNPAVGQNEIMDIIMEERKKELFSEWGHRWLDLKRTGRAEEVLGANNPLWESTDILYPIPAQERMKNPNLTQNPGY